MVYFVAASAGSRENPIHVVNVPRRMGILRELWTLARFLIIAFVVVSLVSSALITPMKTGSEYCVQYNVLRCSNYHGVTRVCSC